MSRALGLLSLAALLLAAMAGAVPRWSSPAEISRSERALGPELALSSSGQALAVWDRESGPDCAVEPASLTCIHIVEAAGLAPGSTGWTAPVELGRPGIGDRPRAGIDAAGDAAVVWVHDIGRDRVVQATYRHGPDGTFPDPNDLSEARLEVRGHRIALDSAGDAVAVWAERADSRFAVRGEIRPAAAGYWGVAFLLSGAAGDVSGGPSLAVAPGGEAIAVWIEDGAASVVSGQAASGTWGTPVRLAGAAEGEPAVAIGRGGDAIVAWPSGSVLRTGFRTTEVGWGSTQDVLSPGPVSTPRGGLDGAGNAIAVWMGGGSLVGAFRARASGVWSRPVLLAPGAAEPELAVDSAGDAVAVWRDVATSRIEAAVRPAAAGAWQPRAIVSEPGASRPRVGIDASGHAVSIWNRRTADRIVAESSDLTGIGELTLVSTRRPVVRGRPRVGATLTCDRGVWTGTVPIRFAYRWLRNGARVPRASGARYLVRPRDAGTRMACRVGATNPARTLTATSPSVRIRRR